MSSLKPDVIQLRVLVDGSPARKELATITQEAVEVNQAMKGLKKTSDEYINGQARLGEITARQVELRKEIGVTSLSIKELNAEMGRARAALNVAPKDSEQWVQATERIRELKEARRDLTDQNRIDMRAWEQVRHQYELNALGTRELNLETKRLKDVLAQPDLSAEERSKASAALAEVTDRTRQLTDAKRIAADAWEHDRQGMALAAMTTEQLAMETERLKRILAQPDLSAAEHSKAAAALATVTDRTKQLTDAKRIAADAWAHERQGIKLTDMSMEQLGMEAERLKAKLATMAATDAGLPALRRELAGVEARTKALASGLGPLGQAWKAVKVQVMSAGAVIGAMFAGGALIQGTRNLIRSAAEYSDAIADVMKTTNLGKDVVKQLSRELSQLDTRTSRAELLALARDAGKLGLSAKEDVLAFVRAGNQINVALGEDLGDDAIKSVGKLVDLFRLKEQFGLEESMLKIGSAINELGMNSTASEGYMVNFMNRLGGIAPIAGLTADQVLALGATLDSLGQTSEVSSTALSRLFVKLGQETDHYASIAGITGEAFKDMLQRDAMQAFIAVLEGAKRTEGGLVALSASLDDMGIDGSRVAGVFGALSNNTDKLAEQLEIAAGAFEKGTSVTDEYNIRNENLAATLAKLQKELYRLISNNRVLQWLERLVGATRDGVEWLKRNADAVTFVAKVLATATVAWVNYRLAAMLWAKSAAIIAGLQKAMAAATALFTGSTNLATIATRAFNVALKANPLGLVASALTMVIGLFVSFGDEVAVATDNQKQHNAELTETARLLKAIRDGQNTTNAMQKLSTEQLEAHRQGLRAQMQQLDEVEARVITSEHTKSGAITKAQQDRNAEILRLEQELRNEQDMQRRFDLQLRLEDLKGAWKEEYDTRRITGQEITKAEADRLKAQLKAQLDAVDAEIEARRRGGVEVVRTVQQIEKEIKELEDRRTAESSDSAKYGAFTKQIEALEAERDRITGGKATARRQKAGEDLDALLRQMEEWRAKMSRSTLDDDEKELAELDAKHAEELRKYKEQQQKLIAARKLTPEQADADVARQEELNMRERAILMGEHADRHFAQMQADNERIQKALGEHHNAQLQADVEHWARIIEQGKAGNRNVLAEEGLHKEALLRLYKQNALDLVAQEAKKWKELIDQAKKGLEDFDAANEAAGIDPDGAVLAERQTMVDNILALETAQAQGMEAINNERRRKEREAERNFTQAARAETVRRLQNFAMVADAVGQLVNSITQYQDAGIAAAEARADEDGVRTEEEMANIERLKSARRTAAMVAIATQGAVAIANGIAQAMTLPPPANIAAAISTVATVVGLIAQARAMMNETSSEAPKFQPPALNEAPLGKQGLTADGSGRVVTASDGGAVLKGPSHAQEGLAVINPKTGRPVAEVEGDELMLILSRAATNANADLIPAMLQASKQGRRMDFLQPGPMPNIQRMRHAMRPQHMRQGGTVGSTPAQHPQAPRKHDMQQQMLQVLNRIALGQEEAARQASQERARPAVVALNPEYDRATKQWNDLSGQFRSR